MVSEVRRLRVLNGFSQTEIASLVEVNVATVRRWEKGQTTPRVPQLHRLAGIFRCTVEQLGFEEVE